MEADEVRRSPATGIKHGTAYPSASICSGGHDVVRRLCVPQDRVQPHDTGLHEVRRGEQQAIRCLAVLCRSVLQREAQRVRHLQGKGQGTGKGERYG